MRFTMTSLPVAAKRRLDTTRAAAPVSRLTVVPARPAHHTSAVRPIGAVPLKLAGVCAVVMTALGAAFTAVAYADASDSRLGGPPLKAFLEPASMTSAPVSPLLAKEMAVLTNQGISPAHALHALHVQGKVAQADLPSKLQASMGTDFAGVWFEPATAQLHIGATSAASRRAGERVAAQTGLAGDVAVTPVRSTMAELLAVQQRWNRKLAHLFERSQVKTGIEPQRNAVSITLSSSVPARERAALTRGAAAATVNVVITVAAGTRLGLRPQAKTECNAFARNAANCNKSLTSGVRIRSKVKCVEVPKEMVGPQFYETEKECLELKNAGKGKWEAQQGVCTAGPLAIPVGRKRETVAITAGHCIEGTGGEGISWEALNRKIEPGLIGKARKFVNGGAKGAKLGDFGEILIEAGGAWQTGIANNPVLAVTAEWKKKEERSYPVKGERLPVVKNTNCHEGQTSGESCGEIAMLNVTLGEEKLFAEGLVEDVGKELIGEGGDSGGPWLFIEPITNEGLMEGSHVGFIPECRKVANQKGKQFFKLQAECTSPAEFPEKEGNEGEWERINYKCKEVAEVMKGAAFYETALECASLEKAGEGKFERTPEMHLVYEPLRQPMAGAAQGSLEGLNLELLTTANEVIPKGPSFKVNGSSLKSTETRLLLATAKEKFTLEAKAAGVSVACTALTLPEAGQMQIQGSAAGNGGVSKEVIEYTGCTVTGNGTGCEVEGKKLKTNPVLNLLGFGNAQQTGQVLVLFEPETGTNWATVHFAGAECKVKETGIEGTVVGGVQVGGQPVLLGTGTETLHGEIKFPHTQLIYIERSSELKDVKAGLKAFGVTATLLGVALLLVDEGGAATKWGVFS
jgi:hypothetical protein